MWGREKAEDPVLAVSGTVGARTVGALTCLSGIPALGQGLADSPAWPLGLQLGIWHSQASREDEYRPGVAEPGPSV